MLFCSFLPALTMQLLLDTKKAKPYIAENGELLTAHFSPWRFLAAKCCKADSIDDVFVVRFFRGKKEWSIQFENIVKCYSFSRYCSSQTVRSLYRTLKLLLNDAKYGFTLPF